jgi:hypothetical protein
MPYILADLRQVQTDLLARLELASRAVRIGREGQVR